MGDISVNLKTTTNQTFTVTVNPSLTVGQWKQQLESTTSIPAQQQRLIYAGQVLKDELTISSYKIQDSHTVHLVRGAARNQPTVSTPTAPATPASTPSPAPQTTPAQPNPFSFPFFGAPAAAGTAPPAFSFPPVDMAQMQQQFLQNPEMMRSVMESPLFQNMLDNPEVLRSMMTSNPNIQALLERNPELGHILNDPQVLRQTMEMARNPELMREMMRNQDTAMRNIETHPEGFNALRRMFTEVGDPLMQAADETTRNLFNTPGATQAAAPIPPSETPNTTPLPNPWARPAAPAAAAPASPFSSLFGAAPAAPAPATGTPAPAANPFASMGMPGMGMGMPAGMMDPQQAAQMLQNPLVQNMMQQLAQNPQMMQAMIQSNPMLRQMMDSNPVAAQMMNDPVFLQQMMNPQNIQSALQFAQMMPGAFPAPPPPAAGTPASPFNFGSMWGSLPSQQPATPAQAPEVRWATQLTQLEDMGFYDRSSNIAALQATNGNVHAAVERLLSNF